MQRVPKTQLIECIQRKLLFALVSEHETLQEAPPHTHMLKEGTQSTATLLQHLPKHGSYSRLASAASAPSKEASGAIGATQSSAP